MHCFNGNLLRGRRQQYWQSWSYSDNTCKAHSCHARPPHRMASDPWQNTRSIHASDIRLMYVTPSRLHFSTHTNTSQSSKTLNDIKLAFNSENSLIATGNVLQVTQKANRLGQIWEYNFLSAEICHAPPATATQRWCNGSSWLCDNDNDSTVIKVM